MGLIQNGYRDICGSFRIYGATVHNSAVPQESIGNWHITGMNRNLTAGEGITNKKVSVPIGYRPPDTWIMPQKTGGLGATGSRLTGSGAVATPGNLAGGLNAATTLAGTGGIATAIGQLVMYAQATLTGMSTMAAPATAALNMSLTMAGSGGLSSADIEYAESKNIYANLSGTSVMSAPLGALVGATATLAGTGSVCCSEATAKAYMSSNIAPATQVTSDVIAKAVWDALAVNSTLNGSMGEAVLAGSGGLVPPTVEEIAAAVLAVLNANNIPVDTVKIKGQTITGSGTSADPWGPV
jgi:hypothetical protein